MTLWSLGSRRRIRDPMTRSRVAAAIVVSALSLAPSRGSGQDFDRVKEMLDVIDAYVEAAGLERACPDWRLNRARTRAALGQFQLGERNFRPPGFLYDKAVAASDRARGLGPAAACAAAATRFGPSGWVESGWMAKR